MVAQPHEKWGEVPCAFVTLKSGLSGTEELAKEIMESAKAHLAKFKVPKRVIFQDLPRNGAGKIQKFVLREVAKKDAAANPKSKL